MQTWTRLRNNESDPPRKPATLSLSLFFYFFYFDRETGPSPRQCVRSTNNESKRSTNALQPLSIESVSQLVDFPNEDVK